jgi:hypothetical protein
MSPLFHHGGSDVDGGGGSHGHLPSLAELGPQLDEVVSSATGQPLDKFAADLMTRYFTTEQQLASQITDLVSVDTICWDLLPDNSGEKISEPIPDAFFSLQDVVTEATQLLQTAGLVMARSYKVGQERMTSQWLEGLVTTRRGRTVLSDGTAQQILNHVYSSTA